MRIQFAPFVVLLCFLSSAAISNDCVTSETPLLQLLDQYSKEHGTKFVVDPRVRAKVTLVGIDPAVLDAGTLIDVLNIHGFTALAKEGVVYVMPDTVAALSGDKFGTLWGG